VSQGPFGPAILNSLLAPLAVVPAPLLVAASVAPLVARRAALLGAVLRFDVDARDADEAARDGEGEGEGSE
jgi:hypothetical protein